MPPRLLCNALVLFSGLIFSGLIHCQAVGAANFSEAETLFREGKIQEAEAIAKVEVDRGIWNRRWSELLIRCQMSTGQYEQALETYDAAIKRYPTSLPLRTLGIDVARFNDQPDKVASEKAMIERYLQTGQLRYATADTLVAAGRFFSENGIDARIILKSFYDRVLESDPKNLEALVATAELAISKGDYAVAAQTIAKAKQRELEDARLDHLNALALRSSDSQAATLALNQALIANPAYEPALILKAEIEIDREEYAQAHRTIDTVLQINPHSPSAFALRAVLAHVDGEYEKEKELRKKALAFWPTNPEVDHLIGRKLSDKYRFAEGAHYQRLALTFDPDHVPATFQLAQDLLRLGDSDVGWKLAEQVNEEDPYNVVAYNLMTLKDRVDGFETIRAGADDDSEPGAILIRMDPTEKRIYGKAVAELLVEAKRVLADKYELELKRPVIVEIFPEQSDFAIRTFGLPGGEGFLGVCFGHVITANSPASQGERPSNWQSVLWHEFCHVITLTKTNNRMPRWLSEGISVYEERLRDPRWGQSMTARYREMILGEDLTPVSQLSGAFLNPPSAEHLQFAYFESSLVVDYLVQEFGADKLNAVLDSLSDGIPINQALEMNVAPIDRIELGFAEFARNQAEQFGSGLEYDRPEFDEETPSSERIRWATENPTNYWARMFQVSRLMATEKYAEAAEQLEFVRSKNAVTGEQGGVLESLARAYRELGDEAKERGVLEQLFSLSSDALPGLERFIEMEKAKEQWDSVLQTAQHVLEIQPFSTVAHQSVAEACERLDQSADAIDSLLALEAMDPIDTAGLDFQLAKSYLASGQTDLAQSRLIDALMTAPRYRDAHRLLLEMQNKEAPVSEASAQESAGKPAASASENVSGDTGRSEPEDESLEDESLEDQEQ